LAMVRRRPVLDAPPWWPRSTPIGRVGEGHVGPLCPHEARHGLAVGGVAAHDAVVTHLPDVTARNARRPRCILPGRLQVEGLRPGSLVPRLKRLQELGDLVLAEAREADVQVGRLLQVGQQAGQELLVPVAGDLVQGQVQELGLLWREVDEHHRDGLQPQPARARWSVTSSAIKDGPLARELLPAGGGSSAVALDHVYPLRKFLKIINKYFSQPLDSGIPLV